MADMDDHAEVEENAGSNGQALMTRDEAHERDRAAFLSGSESDAEEAKPAPKTPTKRAPVVEDDDDDADQDEEATEPEDGSLVVHDEDDDEEEPDEEPEVDDDDDEEAEAPAAKSDPELAKRLAAFRKTEQRARDALARDRASFDAERAEWTSGAKQIAESAQRFERLAARAKYDPAGVLMALGLTEDDMEHAGRQVYSRSKATTVKPEHRDAADREMRAREHADELSKLKQEHQELRDSLSRRDQEAAADRELATFFGRVARAVGDDSPLTKQFLAKNPARAQKALEHTAHELARKLGALPKPADVIRAHEKQRRRDLKDLGVEVPVVAAGTTKTAPKAGDKINAGKSSAGAKPAPKSKVPTRDEIVAELESGDLDLS